MIRGVLPGLAFLAGLFLTPDQWGWFQYRRGNTEAAAEQFVDPAWRGAAEYRNGNFEAAASAFRRVQTAEGSYNLGNALVMQGLYEAAVQAYDTALSQRPDWREAQENRELARARGEALQAEGGNMTDGKLGADEVVFNEDASNQGDAGEEDVMAAETLGAKEQQALWMRNVDSSPADFLKSKFSMQLKQGEGE